MSHVNAYIASALQGVLMQQNTGSRFDFGDILSYCAPLTSLKLLEVNTNPFYLDSKGKRTMCSIGADLGYENSSIDKALDGLIA
jgi:predicted transcriptional regulator